ncbi:MAG: hypothetical protein RR893_12025 [Clostridia bacterium]
MYIERLNLSGGFYQAFRFRHARTNRLRASNLFLERCAARRQLCAQAICLRIKKQRRAFIHRKAKPP